MSSPRAFRLIPCFVIVLVVEPGVCEFATAQPAGTVTERVTLLCRTLGDREPSDRGHAAQELAKLAPRLSDPRLAARVITALGVTEHDRDWRVRVCAVKALGEVAKYAFNDSQLTQCMEPLRRALDDPATPVRVSAIEAVGEVASARRGWSALNRLLERTVDSLVKALRKDEVGVCRAAVEAVGNVAMSFYAEGRTPPLREAVQPLAYLSLAADKPYRLRRDALWAVTKLSYRLRDDISWGTVLEGLGRALREPSGSLRGGAAFELGNFAMMNAVMTRSKQTRVLTPFAPTLCQMLDVGSADDRRDAAYALGWLSRVVDDSCLVSVVVPSLVHRLGKENDLDALQQTAWALFHAVQRIDSPELSEHAYQMLAALLRHQDIEVRVWSAGVLAILGRSVVVKDERLDATDLLTQIVSSDHVELRPRFYAFVGLAAAARRRRGNASGSRFVSTFAECLRINNDDFQHFAARALVSIGPAAVPALRAALTDARVAVRSRAAWGLARMARNWRQPNATGALVSALLAALKDSDPDVRGGALVGLQRVANTAPTEVIAQCARAISGAVSDEAASVRRQALRSIWRLAWERQGRLGMADALPHVQAALNDKDGSVRGLAALALGVVSATQGRSAEALPQLVRLANLSGKGRLVTRQETACGLIAAASAVDDDRLVEKGVGILQQRPPEADATSLARIRTVVGYIACAMDDATPLKRLVPALRDELKSDRVATRLGAAVAVLGIGAGSPDGELQRQGVQALGEFLSNEPDPTWRMDALIRLRDLARFVTDRTARRVTREAFTCSLRDVEPEIADQAAAALPTIYKAEPPFP